MRQIDQMVYNLYGRRPAKRTAGKNRHRQKIRVTCLGVVADEAGSFNEGGSVSEGGRIEYPTHILTDLLFLNARSPFD